jgi:peptidoglycan hydrolase CwlO-like protein
MKKIIFVIAAAIVMAGCNNHEAEIAAAKRSSDSLAAIINTRDQSINEFLADFNQIESNLDSIAHKQDAINVNVENQGEMKSTTKERINQNIAAINELMEANRKKIAELNRKLKGSNGQIGELKKMIATLNEQLAQKDKELADLNEKLNNLNTQVAQLQTNIDTLNQVSAAKSKTIEDQTTALHTAYYVVGKSKDLQTKQVITRTGGLLGIGKTPMLASNIDNSKFTKIDYVQVSTIPIDSKGAKMVTSHPADSYTLNKTKDKVVSIQITNPEKFWSASKYLVVVKD